MNPMQRQESILVQDDLTNLRTESFASILIAQLPFPAMPVVALRGGECATGYASSHDLLARAIVLEQLQGSREDAASGKMHILTSLQHEIFHTWQTRSDEKDAVQKCYECFQRHFRLFFAYYPGCNDLRFLPMTDVDANSVVCKQAKSHLEARLACTIDNMDVAVVLPQHMRDMDYPALIKAYAVELHSYGAPQGADHSRI